MGHCFHVTVVTLFPEIFHHFFSVSLLARALQRKIWSFRTVGLRDYGKGPHKTVDDKGYGGGAGMVLRPDVVHEALTHAAKGHVNPRFIYFTPGGDPLQQSHLNQWALENRPLILLCGRYEGIDERVLQAWPLCEISLGDFVLCGGEIPALAVVEGCVRLLEGTLHNPVSSVTESFQKPLLEHPHYTHPLVWQGLYVPDILLSGHHEKIAQWRHEKSCHKTQKKRPDLWKKYQNCVRSLDW